MHAFAITALYCMYYPWLGFYDGPCVAIAVDIWLRMIEQLLATKIVFNYIIKKSSYTCTSQISGS